MKSEDLELLIAEITTHLIAIELAEIIGTDSGSLYAEYVDRAIAVIKTKDSKEISKNLKAMKASFRRVLLEREFNINDFLENTE